MEMEDRVVGGDAMSLVQSAQDGEVCAEAPEG